MEKRNQLRKEFRSLMNSEQVKEPSEMPQSPEKSEVEEVAAA